ncbi:MAG TPA: cupin domain-containing protein [Pseudonocardiaceae bacterium]|jgi:quercetin dioxygenase-like cupin family protein|nr:cupin domain-containing protein [Pseudonocardiaceae bacterium]
MDKLSLDALAREHLERAARGSSGRSATTVYGGHERTLRQTLVALTAGSTLAEHDSPGEATLIVLRGRVRLHSGDTAWDGRTGDLLAIPPARHSLEALEDSAVVLTVANR